MARKVVGYIRVSHETQVDGYSLDAQRGEIERYCHQHGYDLVRIYADEGISAHTDDIAKRPALAELLADATAGDLDVVVVHTLDRWARNVGVQRAALLLLGKANVGFVALVENFDYSSAHGKFMLTMLGAVAELSSDMLGVHTSKGQRQRCATGLHVGSVPYGYRVGEDGVAAVVPTEAVAVRAVFTRRAAGESNGAIAGWLNSAGYRTRAARPFTAHAVRDILASRFYAGVVTYRDEEFPGRHEAIVTEALWERARQRRQPNPRRRSRPRAEAALRGLVSCAACGHPLHCETNSGGLVLYRERHACDCPTARGSSVVAHRIDDAVGEIVSAIDLRPDWRERIAAAACRADGEADVEALRAQRRRVARAYADGAYDETEYSHRLSELDGRISAASAVQVPDLERVAALCADLPAVWAAATPVERQSLVEPLIDRAYVDLESKTLTRVAPAPAFGALMGAAARRTKRWRAAVEQVGAAG